MGNLKIGDIVARKSYGLDIFFKIADIRNNGEEDIAILKGICYRIQADAPESDLLLQSEQRVDEHRTRMSRIVEKKYRDIQIPASTRNGIKKGFFRNTPNDGDEKFSKPAKVLHIDGDDDYLNTCIREYAKFGIEAVGKYVKEKDQPASIFSLLQENRPDILILTGHDGVIKSDKSYLNVDNYRNSKYFIEGVREARKYEPDLDSLVIFAGACQSMYNELINAGANFASAPRRVLIHALDPVLVSQKIAFASISRILEPKAVIGNTITGSKGIGGVQTRGKYRDGFPLESYK